MALNHVFQYYRVLDILQCGEPQQKLNLYTYSTPILSSINSWILLKLFESKLKTKFIYV